MTDRLADISFKSRNNTKARSFPSQLSNDSGSAIATPVVEISLFFAPRCRITPTPFLARRFTVAKCSDVWKLLNAFGNAGIGSKHDLPESENLLLIGMVKGSEKCLDTLSHGSTALRRFCTGRFRCHAESSTTWILWPWPAPPLPPRPPAVSLRRTRCHL
jgi:hypothetical protein